VFLGSRLANSLLLRYSTVVKQDNQANETASGNVDLDDIEVYGESDSTQVVTSVITNCSLEVCDSILCIGPVSNATVGEPAFLSEEFTEKSDPDLELVLCSGHGKNGALSVLQRTVRPQVVTTFELPGCTNMWTVISDEVSAIFIIITHHYMYM
jgi:cleavage and polyadenylation specificity factor subunit 1